MAGSMVQHGGQGQQQASQAWLTMVVAVISLLGVVGVWLVADRPLEGLIFPEDRFPEVGSFTEFAPISVGDSVTVGAALFPDETTTIDDVQPIVAEGSPEVSVAIVSCNEGRMRGIAGGGSASGVALDDYCDEVFTAAGTRLTTNGEGPGVVAVITALEPGRVVIEGFEVTHSRGPFRRTETSGMRVEVPIR